MNYAKLFTLRKDGRYVGTYRENGKKRYLYDRDPKRLHQRLEQAKTVKPMTIGSILDKWQEEHSAAVGAKTAESYVAPCRRIKEALGEEPIDNVNAARIQALIISLGKRGYSRRTVQLHRDIISMAFHWAILHGFASSSPMDAVSIPHGLKTTKRTIPEDDALEAVRSHTDAAFAPFALLCLYCGLRRGEALALSQEDIDRKNKVIHVRKAVEFIGNQPAIKAPKTAAGIRDVPIPAALEPYIPRQTGLLFSMGNNKPLSKIAYRRRWLAYCEEIGHDITAHQLRHGYATILYEAGVPVLAAQKLLGHTNASTTMNIYTHLREQQEAQAVQLIDNYLTTNLTTKGES